MIKNGEFVRKFIKNRQKTTKKKRAKMQKKKKKKKALKKKKITKPKRFFRRFPNFRRKKGIFRPEKPPKNAEFAYLNSANPGNLK
jgi:hypothetical protein